MLLSVSKHKPVKTVVQPWAAAPSSQPQPRQPSVQTCSGNINVTDNSVKANILYETLGTLDYFL